MNRIKIFGIIMMLLMAIVSAVILNNGCYKDDNDARVTIYLQRNDLALKNDQYKTNIIEKVFQFFSTRAEAFSPEWQDIRSNDLTLIVSSPFLENRIYVIPANSTIYSVIIPVAKSVTFTITHKYFDNLVTSTDQKNWGGEVTVDLVSGDQDLSIKMIPMTWISSISVATGPPSIQLYWVINSIHSSVSSYNIYRSTSLEGPYFLLANTASRPYYDTSAVIGTRYYYRISTSSIYGEGVKCDQKNLVR